MKENYCPSDSVITDVIRHLNALHAEDRQKAKEKKKKRKSEKHKQKSDAMKFEASLKGMTKEEKIAANKERVAKCHPEPDMSNISPAYRRALSKIEFEKSKKKIYMSIVSVPMGGYEKTITI